jgi:hypothetical protein
MHFLPALTFTRRAVGCNFYLTEHMLSAGLWAAGARVSPLRHQGGAHTCVKRCHSFDGDVTA